MGNLIRISLMVLRIGPLRNAYLMRVVGSTKLENELDREGGALSREIKRLNFGQFLFLYFVARNTDFAFVQCLLKKLIDEHAPEWSKTKAQINKDKKKEQIPLQNVKS